MFESSVSTLLQAGRGRGAGPDSRLPDVSDAHDELRRHFREKYPILLDGALFAGDETGHFLRHAREALAGGVDPRLMPAAILGEALAAVRSEPRPATGAGAVAVGPRAARVWWDEALLDDSDDILSGLEKPRPVLRFYDITGVEPGAERWNQVFDIDIALADKGKTIDFWAADRAYLVDLGLIHADGRFLRLARANRFDLPREGRGDPAGAGLVRSNLRTAPRPVDPALLADALAREWAEAGPDHPGRDYEAELLVHMLYRAFLREGPRALRRSAAPVRRDAETLSGEFARRARQRRRRSAEARPAAPALLVARLDARGTRAPAGLRYPPLPVASLDAWRRAELPAASFDLYRGAVDCARIGVEGDLPSLPRIPRGSPPSRPVDLVRPWLAEEGERADLAGSAPVFAAARALRDRLGAIERPSAPAAAESADNAGERVEFGGVEAKRFAKAGVRFTRVTLRLEGHMRPGARLKVAGKLVYADADGNFRLDCVLSGRRAAIPVRAGRSAGGEARGLISVDWEKREKPARRELVTE